MASSRPRVLLITRNLPPLVGGMERLNWHMAEQLSRHAEVRVVGPECSHAKAPADVLVREAPLKPLWKFLWHARALARREARTWKPDLILAGSGLTAPLARSAARVCHAKTAVYVHGLDVAVCNRVYRALWFPAIRSMDRVVANSHATADLCRGIGVDPARIGIVHPGVDLPRDPEPLSFRESGGSEGNDFEPLSFRESGGSEGNDFEPLSFRESGGSEGNDFEPLSFRESGGSEGNDFEPLSPRERGRGEGTESRDAALPREVEPGANPEPSPGAARHPLPMGEGAATFRARHNLANRPLLLSVGRLSARKGLREFVTQALPAIAAAHPDVVLLIVGDAPNDALHAEAQTPDSIRTAAEQAGVAGNLRFLGAITDYAELGDVYRAADVHVFPVREIPGDPEGFGMVAVEAAAHGLPTVAFATGGVPDAVIEGETGNLIRPGDYAAFAACVNTWLARNDHAEVVARCAAAAESFSWRHFGEHLRELLEVSQRT